MNIDQADNDHCEDGKLDDGSKKGHLGLLPLAIKLERLCGGEQW